MPDVDRLLALANGAALHKALVKEGVVVSYRTVARWIGAHPELAVPADMVDPILRAFGLGQEETPPSWWKAASESLVDQIEERISPAPAIPEDLVRRVAQSLADELGLSAPLDDEAPAVDSAEPRDAPAGASKRTK